MKTIIDKNIDVETFFNMLKNNEIQIIDIREKYEYELGNIPNSHHIPMDTILQSINKLEKKKKIIIYCRSGRRSSAVKYMLNREHNIENIYCLSGGYEAYLQSDKK